MTIDVHGHIGKWEGTEFSPEYVIQLMDGAGVFLSIISNLEGIGRGTDQAGPNGRTYAAVRNFRGRLRGLVWINPWGGEASLKNARENLRKGSEFVGLKFHPFHNAYHFDSPEVLPFVSLAAEFNVPLAIHTAFDEYSHPAEVIRVASHPEFAHTNFILYHAGLGPPDEKTGDEIFRQVAAHPNLFIDISWFTVERLRSALQTIPLERILFGTDVPLGGKDHYARYNEQLKSLDLSREQHIKLTESNACSLFTRLQSQI